MVIGDNSCLKGRGFESQRCILDGHFFTLFCCVKLYCLFEKTKKETNKRPGLALV